LEKSIRPHDSSHQNALVSLKLVEHHCWTLLAILAILLAPPDVVVWYMRLAGSKIPVHDATISRLAATSTLRFTEQDDDRDDFKLKTIEEAIINIRIESLVEGMHMSMELTETFNPMAANHKIGSDRDIDAHDDDATGTGVFQEAFVGKKSLENIELKWKGVLSTAPLFTSQQVVTLMQRRFELNPSEHPPLEDDMLPVAEWLTRELKVLQDKQKMHLRTTSSSSMSPGKKSPAHNNDHHSGLDDSSHFESGTPISPSRSRHLNSDGDDRRFGRDSIDGLDCVSSPNTTK